MKAFTLALVVAVSASPYNKVQLHADFIPSETFEKRPVHLPELSYEEMMAHRQSKQYADFLKSPLVQGVHTLLYPFMKNMAPEPQLAVQEEDGWAIAPWSDNLIRWAVRFNLRPICWFVGSYETMWTTTVQLYYDCMTWQNVDLLAFQPNWCWLGFCPKITQLWNGVGADSYF